MALCRRISNPNDLVKIVMEDKGDIHPGYDDKGDRVEGYTTYFEFLGNKFYSFTRKSGEMSVEERFSSDYLFLTKHDLDLLSYRDFPL